MSNQDERTIISAFDKDPALGDRVLQSARQTRDQWQLLLDIASYIQTHASQPSAAATELSNGHKKRKLDDTQSLNENNTASAINGPSSSTKEPIKTEELQGETILKSDVSFTIPVRKKLGLSIVAGPHGGVVLCLPDGQRAQIPWRKIEYAFCLPVPEKAARASYFVLILVSSGDDQESSAGGVGGTATQYVWSCPDRVLGKEAGDINGDAESWSQAMSSAGSLQLVRPAAQEFASAVAQPHRKGELAYHVKAHVGSKEGYLFFLANGIVFGFKKPVLFYPFHCVQSISYTSVLQRTFNLVVTTSDDSSNNNDNKNNDSNNDNSDTTTQIEFSMLDQADFAGIDEYIKRHGLNDASMAAERQAKKYNVNKKEANANGGGVDGDDQDGETELAKAEAQIQDDEDEEEEDYDPGSEGESEGEGGESSDEEQGGRRDDDDGDDADDDDGDEPQQ